MSPEQVVQFNPDYSDKTDFIVSVDRSTKRRYIRKERGEGGDGNRGHTVVSSQSALHKILFETKTVHKLLIPKT